MLHRRTAEVHALNRDAVLRVVLREPRPLRRARSGREAMEVQPARSGHPDPLPRIFDAPPRARREPGRRRGPNSQQKKRRVACAPESLDFSLARGLPRHCATHVPCARLSPTLRAPNAKRREPRSAALCARATSAQPPLAHEKQTTDPDGGHAWVGRWPDRCPTGTALFSPKLCIGNAGRGGPVVSSVIQ